MLCSITSSTGTFIEWIIGDMTGVRGLDIGEPYELPVNSDKEVPDSMETGFPPLLLLLWPPVHSLHQQPLGPLAL